VHEFFFGDDASPNVPHVPGLTTANGQNGFIACFISTLIGQWFIVTYPSYAISPLVFFCRTAIGHEVYPYVYPDQYATLPEGSRNLQLHLTFLLQIPVGPYHLSPSDVAAPR
jgi:hypothetical protein